jgi:hypothetical protein
MAAQSGESQAFGEVVFEDQSTRDYATSPHLRSEFRATIKYGGPHSLDGYRLRIAIEYPHDHVLSPDFQEIALSDRQIPILFRSTYHERRFGQDQTCRLRIADLRCLHYCERRRTGCGRNRHAPDIEPCRRLSTNKAEGAALSLRLGNSYRCHRNGAKNVKRTQHDRSPSSRSIS